MSQKAQPLHYGLEHGQHISFYSMQTLKQIAATYGLNLYSDGKSLHLLTSQRISKSAFQLILKFKKRMFGFVSKHMPGKSHSDMCHLLSK